LASIGNCSSPQENYSAGHDGVMTRRRRGRGRDVIDPQEWLHRIVNLQN
jgi:hypothetical protein